MEVLVLKTCSREDFSTFADNNPELLAGNEYESDENSDQDKHGNCPCSPTTPPRGRMRADVKGPDQPHSSR